MHPDKNPNDPKAADNFLHLNNAYKILMDQEKRALYDETGEYEDNERAPIDLDVTYNYYRLIYPRIKVEDIDNFSEKYRNSKEEENDLIEFYNTNKGNISDILECIPLSTNNDVDRFINIYDRLINQGILKKYKKYEKSKNNINLLESDDFEEKDAENQLDDLQKQIILRQQNRNNDLQMFASKFGVDLNNMPDIDEKKFKNKRKKKGKK